MISVIHPDYLRTLAIRGVQAEIEKLTALLKELESFPRAEPRAVSRQRRRRRHLTKEQRAAISRRMKASWRRRRERAAAA